MLPSGCCSLKHARNIKSNCQSARWNKIQCDKIWIWLPPAVPRGPGIVWCVIGLTPTCQGYKSPLRTYKSSTWQVTPPKRPTWDKLHESTVDDCTVMNLRANQVSVYWHKRNAFILWILTYLCYWKVKVCGTDPLRNHEICHYILFSSVRTIFPMLRTSVVAVPDRSWLLVYN